jgi:hypothetical protein
VGLVKRQIVIAWGGKYLEAAGVFDGNLIQSVMKVVWAGARWRVLEPLVTLAGRDALLTNLEWQNNSVMQERKPQTDVGVRHP